MASGTKSSMRSSGKDDLQQQEIMQAVVIADNFNLKFAPLTNSKPLVLLPLVNGVLLDYILQSLEDAHVTETFIFCCSFNTLIRNYISSSRWSKSIFMTVTVISSATFLSMGDMMRELDSKALIRSDFVLINGAVIATFPLRSIVEKHRNLRQTDKNCAVTLLYRKCLPGHRTRCKEHDLFIAVNSESKRIRYFQRVNKAKTIHVPLSVTLENDDLHVHYDLLDSFVSICSPCVPPLFSDNFDYQSMDDFVKGLIVNEELLGNSMYIHVATSGYGANVSNFTMYDAVSKNMICRWTYPLVPDLMVGYRYILTRPNIYKEHGVEFGRNCEINRYVVIGKQTKIGNNVYISDSVIGRNCVIGDNTVIKGSYLWSDVSIGNDCNLETCLLADKVTLLDKVVIKPGCVLGSEVVIGENITLPPLTKLQAQELDDDDDFGEEGLGEEDKAKEEKTCDVELVGIGGRGFLCNAPEDSDEDEKEEVEDIWGKPPEEEKEDEEETESSGSEILSPGEVVSDESDGAGEEYDDEATYFYGEVLESLQRGIEEKVNSENMILEINSSKHAYNISMKEVNILLIKAMLKLPLVADEEITTPQQYLLSVKPSLNFFHPLVSNYIRSAESQLDCLLSIEEFMKSREDLAPAMLKVLHFWYDKDILNENVILKWYNGLSTENEKIRDQVSAFVKWLEEADEESSEED